MSDLLTRLAARAVGAAPLAAPRPATPFEREPQGDLLELVAEAPARRQVQVPAPGARLTLPGPGRERGDERVRGEHAPALGERSAGSEAGAVGTPPAPREARPSPPPAALEPELEAVLATSAASGEAPPPVHGEDVAVSAARAPAAVAAMPTSTRAAAARPPVVSGDRAQAAPEAPAVRVHIGRLEVRTNLQAPPLPEPARPREAPEPALSLSDYLRRSGGAR